MSAPPDSDELLRRTADGDADARNRLLARHRDRLRQMVAVRLDHRLAARADPSDVVQEILFEADRRLAHYPRQRPLSLYPRPGPMRRPPPPPLAPPPPPAQRPPVRPPAG